MMKISVNAVHFHADSKLIQFVEEKINRLGRYADKAVEAEVQLKLQDNGSKVQEKIAEIRIHMPGNTIVDKKISRSFETAINASVDTLKRQLVRHKERNGVKKDAIVHK